MPHIRKQEIVPYSCSQMYDLVNAVACYHEFVPWCQASTVVARDDNELVGKLTFAKAGLQKSFTTRNNLKPYESIAVNLVDGPFSHLCGIWEFKPQTKGCEVILDLSFAFNNSLLSWMFEPLFLQVANQLVQVFCGRASMVYGDYEVEIAYANNEAQKVMRLLVPFKTTVEQAIYRSGILNEFPEIELPQVKVGIFSRLVPMSQQLQPGDRVEIYLPLQTDPKLARLKRALASTN